MDLPILILTFVMVYEIWIKECCCYWENILNVIIGYTHRVLSSFTIDISSKDYCQAKWFSDTRSWHYIIYWPGHKAQIFSIQKLVSYAWININIYCIIMITPCYAFLKFYEEWILMMIGQFCGTKDFYILRVMWIFVCFCGTNETIA